MPLHSFAHGWRSTCTQAPSRAALRSMVALCRWHRRGIVWLCATPLAAQDGSRARVCIDHWTAPARNLSHPVTSPGDLHITSPCFRILPQARTPSYPKHERSCYHHPTRQPTISQTHHQPDNPPPLTCQPTTNKPTHQLTTPPTTNLRPTNCHPPKTEHQPFSKDMDAPHGATVGRSPRSTVIWPCSYMDDVSSLVERLVCVPTAKSEWAAIMGSCEQNGIRTCGHI